MQQFRKFLDHLVHMPNGSPTVRAIPWSVRLSVVAMTITITAIAVAPLAFAKDKKQEAGSGCAPDRPAIAHVSGGFAVETPRGKQHIAPIPCVTKTSFRTSEIAIVITNEGTVLFEPALATEINGLPIGVLARSVDAGTTWQFIDPTPPAILRETAHDTTMVVDRQTGRVFWNSSNGPPFGGTAPPHVDHSDDDGRTWVSSSTLPVLFDDTHVFTGPPTKSLEHLMEGYPNVVYACVSGGFTCGTHNFCGTHCTKSIDGGQTWLPAVAVPFPSECPVPTFPSFGGGYLSYGVVDREGTVYLPFTPCQRPYVAISHDEGATWSLSLVAETETIGFGAMPLGMDKARNLYAAYVASADRLPYLVVSRDQGLHWSTPLMIAAPQVNEAALPQLVAGKREQVAVSYYGSRNSPGPPFPPPCNGPSLNCPGYEHETWNTYITETWNALAPQPLFWSATLNDPTQPTWYGVTPSAIGVIGDPDFTAGAVSGGTAFGDFAGIGGPSLSGRMDYFGMTMASDNTPWVGFGQQCPFGLPVLGNPNCPSTLTGTAPDSLFVHGEADDDNEH